MNESHKKKGPPNPKCRLRTTALAPHLSLPPHRGSAEIHPLSATPDYEKGEPPESGCHAHHQRGCDPHPSALHHGGGGCPDLATMRRKVLDPTARR